MTQVTEFLNGLIVKAKEDMISKNANCSAAFDNYNGKFVLVSVSRVNTNSKNNVVQVRYSVNRKSVSAAKIADALK